MSDEDRPVLDYATAEDLQKPRTVGTVIRLVAYIPVILLGVYVMLRAVFFTPSMDVFWVVLLVGLLFTVGGGLLVLGTIRGWLQQPPNKLNR